ncbi:hypothetical protein COCMIDRAFT_38194 [Bipolaris oryzae ATCC 44560]|uniref:trimethyllysine dioxygenase n=1 Tax=Bipolaris oryzae ATCC 44560 TaxID=930090 RepID=W6Z8Q2_COCMI|nr:uncharacterized protein COCMIDRAFT_38194 [Bipolaris oryzae ATCC 44560]EUC43924.1 hypothetical protein COCMIDRAFT_38194 [Bipolaris oryzae ATCC 44560]
MLAARASRWTSNAANVTRCVSQLRPYSEVNTITEAKPTRISLVPYTSKLGSRARSYHLGKADPLRANSMPTFLRQAQFELSELQARRRGLYHKLQGPYRVRGSVTAPRERRDRVEVREGSVWVGDKRVPNVWLRDNCQCARCMHGETRQRLLDSFGIPPGIGMRGWEVEGEEAAAEEEEGRRLKVVWEDGHESLYPFSLLRYTLQTEGTKVVQRLGLVSLSLWDQGVASEPPIVEYEGVMRGEMAGLLKNLREYGFCYVDGTPVEDPQDTKALLEKIAFIRETHYGGFYDFTADLASKDTAYTNIALEAHTDTTYFSDPAGLQAFHLLSHTDGEGGASLLVDGFKVAEELLETDKKAYEILATVNVHGHASGNDGISIQPYRGFPVLEHDIATGDLLRVRWNSSDRASIELPIDQVEKWYDAARKFDALLKKKENEYWEQLKPGRVLIFDNWRVLHGRSSFTGKRRICGAYINRDDWISKFKMAHFGQSKVLEGLPVN